VLLELENLSVIDPLAFENAGAVVQAVGQNVRFGIAPGHKFPVQPDMSFAIVKGYQRHFRLQDDAGLG
jgi:hypothetical protein